MTRVLKYCICSVLVLLTFLSCKRTQKDGMLGPDLKVASSNFAIVDSFKVYGQDKSLNYKIDTVNFSKPTTITDVIHDSSGVKIKDTTYLKDRISPRQRSTYFKAKFNESVKWKIEISPVTSDFSRSPYKLLTGTSDYIDSIPEWTWDGSSDNQFYFVPGLVNFKLSFLGSNKLSSINKFVKNVTLRDSTTQGILLNDFEGGISIVPYGDNKDNVANPLPSLSSDFPNIPQGIKVLSLFGNDHNGDYFVGGNTQPFAKGMLAGRSASDIYINAYIYGYPPNSGITPNATKIAIGVSQDNVNNSGKFDALFEDTFDQQISVDWVGWKLISVKYSNLKRSSSTDNGGNGPNKIQPETAVAVGCNILSSPNGNTVGAAIDYLIITFGKPLDK
ncbi:MAG: hypothetical protein H7329_14820 [Opitutaceae bacterium]|nr:hypothetical protein [Cytophagales bacterium]